MPRADAEIAIVGAGVMGLATAWALARAGRSVVVCEQFEVGHVNGSSHGGSRIIRLSYPEERWVRLAQEAYPLWQELEAGWGRALLDQPGTIDLGDWGDTGTRWPRAVRRSRCWTEPRPGDASRSGWTAARRGSSSPTEGSCTPTSRCRRLLGAATAAGADVRERTRVESIEDEGETVSLDGLRRRPSS